MKTTLLIFLAMLVAGSAFAQSSTADVPVTFTIPTYMTVWANQTTVAATFVDDAPTGDGVGHLVADASWGIATNAATTNWALSVTNAPWFVFSPATGIITGIGSFGPIGGQVRRVIDLITHPAGSSLGCTITMTIS